MARPARTVLSHIPHHVTQRGNGGQQTFFAADDYTLYRDLLARQCRSADVAVWAWRLMPNHVHLILVPQDPDGLRRALSKVHRGYGRCHSCAAKTDRAFPAGPVWRRRHGRGPSGCRRTYVLLNPVRARLAARAQDWLWSSVHAQLSGRDDGLTTVPPVRALIPDLADQLDGAVDDGAAHDRLRRAESTGRPLGSPAFLKQIERRLGRQVTPRKRGPKPKQMETVSN